MHSSSHIATVCCQVDVCVCPQSTVMHAIIQSEHCQLGMYAEHMNTYNNCAYTCVRCIHILNDIYCITMQGSQKGR